MSHSVAIGSRFEFLYPMQLEKIVEFYETGNIKHIGSKLDGK